MFLRLLLLVGALALLWWASRRNARLRGAPRSAAAPRRAPAGPEQMLRCAHCGVHLPASEAMRDVDAHPYCCAEHRSAGPRAPRA